MSKKIIALAIAALAPAAAMAENANVTMYGVIDYGYGFRSGNVNGRMNQTSGRTGALSEFAGGISAGNRLGFKGSEDLGNGLKAIFEIEFSFVNDVDGTFNKNRHTWVGLTGNWGTLLGGRVDGARYSFTGKYDPFKNQTVANAGSILGYTSQLGQADRANNAIVYVSPNWAGFSFLGAYTKSLLTAEGVGATGTAGTATTAASGQGITTGDSPLFAVAAMYDNGPVSVTLDYESLKLYSNNNRDTRFALLVAGASYDFGPVKLSGYYENVRQREGLPFQGAFRPSAATGKNKADGWVVGLSAPIGPVTVMANYVQGRDKTPGHEENDCRKFGIGAEYALSKRTAFYTTAARINADDNAACGISYAASANALPAAGSTTSYGRTGFDIGMRHSF